jgi:glycosyltransferase involved in cell wall biosynthesis
MHILEIPSFFPPYGGEFCLEQAKALKNEGHEVRILSNVQLSVKRSIRQFLTLPRGSRFQTSCGIEVYQTFMRGMPKVVRPNVRRWLNIVQRMYATYELRYGRPDVIHAHCAKWAGVAAMLIGRRQQVPYVITEHLSSEIFREEFGEHYEAAWQVPMLRAAYQSAQNVVMVSSEQADDLAPFFGKDYHHVVISNIIDTDFFAFRKWPPLDGREYVFCCVAHFIPLKGYDVLFRAFELLRSRGCRARLLIAGNGTQGRPCTRQMKRLAPSGGITALGQLSREEVRQLLYQSDCMVLASRSEAQPLSLLEAMSTGIPYVATSCIPQSMRIEGASHIVAMDDVNALADAMMERCSETAIDGRRIAGIVKDMASPWMVGRSLSAVLEQAAQP